jgi:biotin transporter BioY
MGPISGILIAFGIVFIAIGVIVRKFWPHKRGSISIWVINFEDSEWLSLMVNGIFWLVLGLFVGSIASI